MIRRERRVDLWLPACTLGLSGLGLVAIYSATRVDGSDHCWRQALWLLLGTGFAAIVSRVDYRSMVRLSRLLYVVNLGLLAAVLLTGSSAMGAQRWIALPGGFKLQPSEIAKLVVIITLSTYCTSHRHSLRDFWGLCKSFLFILPPMALIMKQPDLGTSLVLIAVWFGILWVAGARALHLAIIALSGVVAFVGLWHVGLIKDYQKQRLISFLDPSADPRGSGWHTIQSKIAIGSGGLTGKGLLHGSQSQGGFIPEQHTDFINTVIGEELGFIGSSFLLLLFFCLIYRGLRVAWDCADPNGRLIAVGIVTMFTFHVFVNIGMTVHIMPVTGVPLPFLSYGGSSMILNLACIAVLINIERHREDLRF
ncbi:MAG TPA: rod shape-determining protein RodA [Armatimonadota bacterium]|jgi:rod shape determining protein RodA|nr:rod shape-determining protein RodA [Armatimonadota bacterium]HOM83712.1 rod shape-determining protein RodA [Armatimonadota bacterium]HOQ28210.1 rod shape-determining protein RodA [Armatimonadota bacterium]HPO71369.1 rod shape-determining protein RodA [Armatimonadota bacterium]HPU00010.1 rod shape-determining protein RodA [Armatimonadota bacterium]